MSETAIRAVLWDFGGVILSSPFDAFARYEAEVGLPAGFIRRLNAANPHANAWAKLERAEVDLEAFCTLFEAEARAAGGGLNARTVVSLLAGEVRPEMVRALRAVGSHYRTACLTNNVRAATRAPERAREIAGIMALFDHVIESSKVGVRKPEPRFYEIACEIVGIRPEEAVFLDDLGVNLKPARALGMRTIKVLTPGQALADLERVLGHPLV